MQRYYSLCSIHIFLPNKKSLTQKIFFPYPKTQRDNLMQNVLSFRICKIVQTKKKKKKKKHDTER